MNLRVIGTLAMACCLVAAMAPGGQPDVKPDKKTFRAADGASIVSEVGQEVANTLTRCDTFAFVFPSFGSRSKALQRA